MITAHVDELVAQLAKIIADGVQSGDLATDDPRTAGRAVFDATSRFHNPAHAATWDDAGIDDAFEAVYALLVAGLRAP